MSPPAPHKQGTPDLIATLLGLAFVGGLIVSAFWILRPFVAAAIWAVMIVVATWPLMLRLELHMHSRPLAILCMIILLLLVFVIPTILAVTTVVANAAEIAAEFRALTTFHLPSPPSWLDGLPFVGSKLSSAWRDAGTAGLEGIWARFSPYAGSLTAWFVARAGNVGSLAVQFLLTLVLAGALYTRGEKALSAALRLSHRLGGARGEELLQLASQAIRGVAVGVGLTAVIQAVLGGLGLLIAGVPFAGFLTSLMFLFCISQIGALVVLLPATVWVFWTGHPGWGSFLIVWSVAISVVDTFLRPILVRRNADLPLLLIFGGVVGGLVAFGLVGIFVGPVVLAVAYTLLFAWIAEDSV
jgi:predicted PurR-regulated permease PerM